MSPAAIIDLQRRLALVGAIRCGERGGKGEPRRLDTFRLTSARRELIEQAASRYGGTVSPWQSPVGSEWQVTTSAAEIPVLVMPGYSLRQTYELWSGPAKRERLCDGIDEELSGGPCICNRDASDVCDLYTRLVVALPELDTVLGWRLITKGVNAAHELPTMLQLLATVASGQALVPARLRLEERRGQKDGQTLRFVVPVIDLGVGYLALTGQGRPGLPAGPQEGSGGDTAYVPTTRAVPTLEQALEAVSGPPPPSTSPRAAAPIGPTHDEFPSEPLPVEADEPLPTAPAGPSEATAKRNRQLDYLVGTLREGGHITTDQLWQAIAKLRKQEAWEELVAIYGGRDRAGQLHWAPLREALDEAEGEQLLKWLRLKEQLVRDEAEREPYDPATAEIPY